MGCRWVHGKPKELKMSITYRKTFFPCGPPRHLAHVFGQDLESPVGTMAKGDA